MKDIPPAVAAGPFTVRDGAELGLTARVLEGRRFSKPWRGVRVVRGAPETLFERCRAAALVLPHSAVFSHETALELGRWLAPGMGDGPSRYAEREDTRAPIHVTVPHHAVRPQRVGMVGHRTDLLGDEILHLGGLRVTSPWRTWLDLGATSSEVDLVILADALRRRVGTCPYQASIEGRRGARALRRALTRSRSGVDSPMETRLRLLFEDAELPEPAVNRPVVRSDGSPLHRPDLSWPRWRVAADYDGRHHADRDSPQDVRSGRASDWRVRQDISRGDLLDDEGWILRVFTSFDVFHAPARAVERMRAALRRGGADV